MKRKGFTLIELLVVIAIIALLMGILMPALARVRQMARKMVCGTNLSGIGKAMLVYEQDHDETFPVAGGPGPVWSTTGAIDDWQGQEATDAYGMSPGAVVTVTSSLYLLVKYSDVSPKQFVCAGDTGTKVMELSDAGVTIQSWIENLTDCWDFGGSTSPAFQPGKLCSYCYHLPYSGLQVSSTSMAGTPLCAERSPYFDKNADSYINGASGEAPPTWATGTPGRYVDDDKTGNAAPHQREGQNVVYNDGRVEFEDYPNVGIANDNIYKYWPGGIATTPQDKELCNGGEPTDMGVGGEVPGSRSDAFLVQEDNRN